MSVDGWYVQHLCGHRVTWLEPSGMPIFGEVMRSFRCPWCGGEAGKPKPTEIKLVVFGDLPGMVAWQGWAQTPPEGYGVEVELPNSPPGPAGRPWSFDGAVLS